MLRKMAVRMMNIKKPAKKSSGVLGRNSGS
jgi:hypothetical protein